MAKTAAKPAHPGDKLPLSRERIELAALELMEEEGQAGFSTRKLAARLGYEAMSIYHYFPSKGHLMDALVDRVIGEEMSVLDPKAGPWRRQLEMSAWEWRRMALRHPVFFGYLALHRLNTPTGLRWLNGVLGVMRRAGLPHEAAVRLFRVVGYYLNGCMMDETAGYTRGPSTVAPVADDIMRRDYPEVVEAGRWFAQSEREKTYELGLKLVLDGIEREISRPA